MSELSQRQQRLSDMIRHGLMDILPHKIRDPELRQVTITSVRASKDLNYAKVFYTLLSPQVDEAAQQKSNALLERLSGYLRYHLAQVLQLRRVPHLHFIYDEQLIKGQRLAQLIDQAI